MVRQRAIRRLTQQPVAGSIAIGPDPLTACCVRRCVSGLETSRSDRGYQLVLATVVGSDAFGERASPRAKDREWIVPRFPAAGSLELTVAIADRLADAERRKLQPR
jgi:hypothetical protein